MRLNRNLELSAADIVNSYPETELANIIFEYGEERYSRRIASAIVKARKEAKFEYAKQLADVIWKAVPAPYRRGRNHPATKSFQAIRIVVNGELARLEEALEAALRVLKPGGKMGVISFHSLEDRIVKRFFKKMSLKCICPPEAPVCTCRAKSIVKILTKKPVAPEESEVKENQPSRSSKLRVVEKVNEIMKFIRKIFFFIIVLSVPVLLFMNVNQSFRYERLATEIDSFELEQKEWLEENKKMLSTYSVFSSPARVQKITENLPELSTADPGQSIIVNIRPALEGSID